MALLRKETCNLRHPMGLCHPVQGLLAVIQTYICILRYGDVYIEVQHINKQTNTAPPGIGLAMAWACFAGGSFSIAKAYMYMVCLWLLKSIEL